MKRPVPDRAELIRWVQRRCAEILEIPEPEPDANFFDLGGDSLSGMELSADFEDLLRVEVELQWLFDSASLSHFVDTVLTTPTYRNRETDTRN